MKPWMLPWLLPVALVAGVLIVVVFSANEALAAAVAGVLLLPLLWRLYSPRRGEHDDTNYWRLPRR
jgi:hypothetical protein